MCVSVLLILTVVYRVVRLLTVEVKVILPTLVSSRTGPSYIKDHRVASVKRRVILSAIGRLVLVLGRTVRVLGPRSIITKPVDMLLLL